MSRPFRFSRHWLWLLLALPVALGLWRLRFDVEILNLLPPRSPAVQGLKLYQENFANARELIITIHTGEAEQAESAARAIADALRRATNLTASVEWQPPWLEHPGQSAELVAFLWLNQPPAVFAELTNRLTDAAIAASLAESREQLATSLSPDSFALSGYDPFNLTRLPGAAQAGAPAFGSGQEFFASADGAFRVVFVEAARDLASYRACLAWLDEVKAVVGTVRTASVKIHYTGRPAFVAEIAGGMERDMFGSVGGTLIIIAVLFALVHRRALPLLWLVALLVLLLGATMAIGGLIYGPINVVSMGFAAILLGLGVDYGLVLYQEAQAAPHLGARDIRREAGPGIFWSAVTTAGAFLILNLSSLPGLAQLGTLVAIGVALAAAVMLFAYLPPLRRAPRPHSGPIPLRGGEGEANATSRQPPDDVSPSPRGEGRGEGGTPHAQRTDSKSLGWIMTLLGSVLIVEARLHPPRFDHSTDALRPKHSSAYAALDQIKQHISGPREPLWLLIPGRDEAEVTKCLDALAPALNAAVSNQFLTGFNLPTTLWPNPAHQFANRPALTAALSREPSLRDAAFATGFSSNSLALTESLFVTWRAALQSTNTFWPTNAASRWVLDKFTAQPGRKALALPLRWQTREHPAFLALGLLHPATNSPAALARLAREAAASGAFVSGWPALGGEVFDLVKHDLPRVLGPMAVLLLASLWLAFRRPGEVLFSLASLAFAGLLLHLTMRVAGWSWNLMNLMALPLLLGAGVDYSIHMQLALRRHAGDARAVRRTVGRALFLCAATTVAGFGSLAWSSNAGLASLGQVCAAGVASSYFTAVFVLPIWWNDFLSANRRPAPAT